MFDITALIVQLASGAWGGSLAGSLFKGHGLGRLGMLLAGSVGGALGGQMIATALSSSGTTNSFGLDPGSLVSQFAGGGVGGGLVVVVVALLLRRFGG